MRNKKLDLLEGCFSQEGHLLLMTHRLAQPGKLGQGETIRACARAVVSSWIEQRGHFFLIKTLAKVGLVRRVNLFPRQLFSYIRGLNQATVSAG